MPLTGRALVQLSAELTRALDLSTTTDPISRSVQFLLADGSGANQANRIWHDQRTLAASATEDLDLAGVLTDPFGAVITFARVKLLYVAAAAGNTNNVVLGGHATAAWLGPFGAAAHTTSVQPGDVLFHTARGATGWPVTAGTADMLKVANSGAGSSVIYDIVVIGSAS